MKRIIPFLLCVAVVLSLPAFSACGEANVPDDTEITYATKKPQESSAYPENTSGVSTEGSVSESDESSSAEEGNDDPGVVTGDPVAPEDYYDHSAQLLSLGFEEGSDEYALYDALFDVSCKVAYYDKLFQNSLPLMYANVKKNYYKPLFPGMKEIADALLNEYGVGYPKKKVLPPEMKLPPYSSVYGSEEYKVYEQKVLERFLSEADTAEEIVKDLKALFGSPVLSGYAGADEMLRLAGETLDNIILIKPYLTDPLRDETVEIYDEYDAELDMVRLVVTTTGGMGGKPGDELFTRCTVESYTENGDGTVTLTALISRWYAFSNNIFRYYEYPLADSVFIGNKYGMSVQVPIHFRYPYYENSGIDWDAPVRVKGEQLHKALSLLFFDLKGTEEYTMRDLSMITKLQVEKGRIWMYFGTEFKYVYPEYAATAKHGSRGVTLLPSSEYYLIKGEKTEEISEEDLAMFVNLGITDSDKSVYFETEEESL